jgi:hypothetical protein
MSFLTAICGAQARCWGRAKLKALPLALRSGQWRVRELSSNAAVEPENHIKYIRNIGIVAHVDAVSFTFHS